MRPLGRGAAVSGVIGLVSPLRSAVVAILPAATVQAIRSVYRRLHDRRIAAQSDRMHLEQRILPALAAAVAREVLFVDTPSYTRYQPGLCEGLGIRLWSDIDPEAAAYGAAGRHLTCDIRAMPPLGGVRLDAAVLDGVFGYGVDYAEGGARARCFRPRPLDGTEARVTFEGPTHRYDLPERVQPRNRRLERRYGRAPEGWLDRIEAAAGHGIDWFRPQPDLTMAALHVLDEARRRPANPRLGFLDDRIRPPDILTVRLYLPVELLMIYATWAERRDFAAVLAALRARSDDGRYGSTEIVVGGLAMKRAGVEAGGEIDRIMAAEAPVIACARNMPPLGRSNQHATSLAIGALSQFAHHERRRLSRRSP